MITALSLTPNPDSIGDALNSLNPEGYAATRTLGNASARHRWDLSHNRLRLLRWAGGETDRGVSPFFVGGGEWLEVDGSSDSVGYRIRTGQAIGGLELGDEQGGLGAFVGYADSNIRLDDSRGSIGADSLQAGLYASMTLEGAFVNLMVSASYDDYSSRRRANGGTARAEFDGWNVGGAIGGGYDFYHDPGFVWSPNVSVLFNHFRTSSFSERGPEESVLRVDGLSENSVRGYVGVDLAYEGVVAERSFRPQLSLGLLHEFGSVDTNVDGELRDVPNGSFRVTSEGPSRNLFVVDAGGVMEVTDRASAYLNYNGRFGSDSDSHGISGGVRIAF